ncbi:PKD domain-containing protein [Kitasatospora sp. NPDC088346]|uniref:right-handed parallel beta-helix repeat-containing protein n=1 Tax=Kitasatospora sp. NPDC088346 TaxID=3364073 RepID=UPI003800EBE4
MRIRRALGLSAAVATTVLGVPAPAQADSPATLYVDTDATRCSDTGPGSSAEPFCHIATAAALVEPGQTVRVAGNRQYREEVHLTRSGTPAKPITFVGGTGTQGPLPLVGATGRAFVLSGVHDVVVQGFNLRGTSEAVAVTASSRVTLDGNQFGAGDPAVRVSGPGDHVTVSRNRFHRSGGVTVEGGARDTLVTTNDLSRTLGGVRVTDASGPVVVHNTVAFVCGPSVVLDGASAGAVVANNVLTGHNADSLAVGVAPACGAEQDGTEVSVSAGSTTGSTVDHNVVHPFPNASAYTWAGTAYRSPKDFAGATGQGAHDVDQDIAFDTKALPTANVVTEAATAAVDAADPAAPGALPTDLLGTPPLDDPLLPNAPGSTGRDRGAYELKGLRSVTAVSSGAQVPSPRGPAPFTARVTPTAVNAWPTKLTYTYDFGDGTPALVTGQATADHAYASPGVYRPTVVATDELGARVSGSSSAVTVGTPGPLVPSLVVNPNGPLSYTVDTGGSTGPWAVNGWKVDFGDGTAVVPGASPAHTYAAPGRYTITLTETDEGGRTASVGQVLDVDYDRMHKDQISGERVRVIAGLDDALSDNQVNYTSGTWYRMNALTWLNTTLGFDRTTRLAAAYTRNGDLHAVRSTASGWIQLAEWQAGTFEWRPWENIIRSGPTGTALATPGGNLSVDQVAATSIGNTLHVVALAGGRVFEATRDYDTGTWSGWGEISAEAHLPGPVTRIAASAVGNALHVAALGADGHLRIADGDYTRGTWSSGDLTAYRGGPGGVTELATATIGSRFHVLAVSGGRVQQITGDYAGGDWNTWADVSAATGLGGSVSRISAAATGNTLHLYAVTGGASGTNSGGVYSADGDYTRGTWSSWADITAPERTGPMGGGTVFTVAAAGR